MSKCRLKIWGREFLLEVHYLTCAEEDHEILPGQIESCLWLLSDQTEIASSLDRVKAYIAKDELSGVEFIDNIFRYVMPASILIPQDEKHQAVAILCEYRFDPDTVLRLSSRTVISKRLDRRI